MGGTLQLAAGVLSGWSATQHEAQRAKRTYESIVQTNKVATCEAIGRTLTQTKRSTRRVGSEFAARQH